MDNQQSHVRSLEVMRGKERVEQNRLLSGAIVSFRSDTNNFKFTRIKGNAAEDHGFNDIPHFLSTNSPKKFGQL